MGAAFSPKIANIFMSTIIRDFLKTQAIKPLIFSRYIDDIFMIWIDTMDNLKNFLFNLNCFHSSLSFTHECSPTTIDFLDLTIYKGLHFHITNILDTKTFQKQQLYLYLHFTSTHPPKVFKAIIKGECTRYVRTNTSYETYTVSIHQFKIRLHKRDYPKAFVQKAINTVKYNKRHQYLIHSQPPPPICSPPLFKTTPPPKYHLLKHLILKDYALLKFTTPRFISLRHPTLHNILVRAKICPTDEQILDIYVHLENIEPTTHTETVSLPKLQHKSPTITPCRQPKCATCKYHLLSTPTFCNTQKTPTTYRIRHQLSCSSTNVIYLITCCRCKKQYVGCTTKQLKIRINHHRSNIINKKNHLHCTALQSARPLANRFKSSTD